MRDDQLIANLTKIKARAAELHKASEATKERWLDTNAPFAIGDILVGSLHSRYWQETGDFVIVYLGVKIADDRIFIRNDRTSQDGYWESVTPVPELLVTVHQLTKRGAPHGGKDPFVVTMIKRDGQWIAGSWHAGEKDRWSPGRNYYTVRKP